MLGSRGIWHDGWKAVTNHPTISRLEPLQRRRVGAVPHRRRPVRAAQPRRRAPREGPRARQPLVRRGRRQRRLPARRPLGARDHAHARAGAVAAARPLHLLPRRRRGARVAGGQRPQPLVHDRRAASTSPSAGAEGVLFAHGSPFGGHALYVKDNRLHYVYNFVGMGEETVVGDRGPPDRREPDPVGVVRQGRRGPARRRDRHALAVARRRPRSARAGSRPSPASS